MKFYTPEKPIRYTSPPRPQKVVKAKEEPKVMDNDSFETPRVIDVPKGRFPALSNKLQSELGKLFDRQNNAITDVIDTARRKTEFLESLADKAKQDLDAEKHELTRTLGGVD